MDFAEADWVTVITEGKAKFALARIERVIPDPATSTTQQSSGTLQMTLVRSLDDDTKPQEFVLNYLLFSDLHRRIKSGEQGWNGVDIATGTQVVVAAPADAWKLKTTLSAIAVAEVDSEDAPLFLGIARSVEIENLPEAQRQKAIVEAIPSDLPVLLSYSHYSIGRLSRIPRDTAIEVECRLASDQAASHPQRLSAATVLERSLWKVDMPTDVGNHQILATLVLLLGDSDPEIVRSLVPMVYRRLSPSEGIPSELRPSISVALHKLGTHRFTTLESLNSDPSIGKEATELLDILQKASSGVVE